MSHSNELELSKLRVENVQLRARVAELAALLGKEKAERAQVFETCTEYMRNSNRHEARVAELEALMVDKALPDGAVSLSYESKEGGE